MTRRSLALLLLVAAPSLALAQQPDSGAPVAAPAPAPLPARVPATPGAATRIAADTGAGAARDSVADTAVAGETTTDSIFLRAQRLVAQGKADSGRAIVQAELEATPKGTPRYVEALYWRAVVAPTAADAERDLRTLIIDYPLSPHAADALMRLAQLEITRGDDDQALRHLKRVTVEHPNDPARPRADFWMARMLFDKGDAPQACARLADAEQAAPASDVEMRNQIEYLNQRCANVDTTAAAAAPAAPAPRETPRERGGKPAPGAAGRAGASAPATSRASEGRRGAEFTVQVAAYSTRGAAERLRASLAARGYAARVVGTSKPYRVRVGRYATRAAAEAEARAMRARKLGAYVTTAEPR